MRKVDRHLLPLFFMLALFCSLDRANLSFAAKMLEVDLGFSAATYGLGSGNRHSRALSHAVLVRSRAPQHCSGSAQIVLRGFQRRLIGGMPA